tara:strand:- start:1732 stop:2229 length:498 start_codon:yes stop_codon:yes gene_type:complete
MGYGNQFKSSPVSSIIAADTAELYPIGSVYVEPVDDVVAANSTHEGDRLWVYVKGGSGAITANSVVARDAGASPFTGSDGAATSTAAEVIGIANYAIATGSYGWVIRRGCAEADCLSVTAGVDIVPAAAGEVNDVASPDDTARFLIGTALDTAATALGTVYLTLP